MSSSTVFLARFTEPSHLVPALAHLRKLSNPVEWEALDGHMQMAVRTHEPDRIESEISNLDGLESLIRCDVIREIGIWPGMATDLPRAWICIETEPGRHADVAAAIGKLAELKYLAYTSGACDFVGVIEAPTLAQLELIVAEQIRPLDGVVRMKHDRVISLTQL